MDNRPAIVQIDEHTTDEETSVTISLSWQDEHFFGTAAGSPDDASRARLVGEATLRAVEEVAEHRIKLQLEAVATTELGATQIAMAQVYLQVARTEDAIDELWDILDREPGNQQASRLLCEALAATDDLLSLEEELRRRTDVAPEDGMAWCMLALVLDQEGDPEECEEVTVRAWRLRAGVEAERPGLLAQLQALAERLGILAGDGPP